MRKLTLEQLPPKDNRLTCLHCGSYIRILETLVHEALVICKEKTCAIAIPFEEYEFERERQMIGQL